MTGRMSNRDRIAQAAREAEEGRKQREQAANARKSRRGERAPPRTPAGRVRVVWAVCDSTGAIVATHPYADEDAARREAEQLTEEVGKPHFVRTEKVPFD